MAVIIQLIFTLFIGVVYSQPPHFDHLGITGRPPHRNIFTDFVHNLANGFLGGLSVFNPGSVMRPGGYNFQPTVRPGYGEYYGNDANVGVNIPGQGFGINDHRGPQLGGSIGNDNGYDAGVGLAVNNEVPETNTAAPQIPQKPDISGEKDKGDGSVNNNYFIVVPLNPNGIKPQGEPNLNINGASINNDPNNAIVDVQVSNLQKNPEKQDEDANKQLGSDPELRYNVNTPQEPKEGNENKPEQINEGSIGNENVVPLMVDPDVKYNTNKPEETKVTSPDNGDTIENKVPGFNDADIEKGISMTDPELKHSGTDELDKFRNPEAIVFPNEGSEIIIENLPNRFSGSENSNKPSSNVQVTLSTSGANAGTQNQNPNEQVPTNPPYVNGAGSSNGAYTVVNTPSSTENSGSGNGNAGVSSAGQSNSPYVNVVGNPNGYTVMSVPNSAGTSGQSYVVPDNANSGAVNPSMVYVLSNGNSGVVNPGQSYTTPNYGYNDVNKPTMVYIPYDGNSGGNPNQVYVLGNPGQNGQIVAGGFTPRPIVLNIPGSGAQTTTGGYYKPIFVPATNGQINVPLNYKPVVTVPGYQVLGNNPGVVVSYQTPGNVMTPGGGAPPLNVPLLISYKDDESDEDDKKDAGKKKVKVSFKEDHADSRHNKDEMIEH